MDEQEPADAMPLIELIEQVLQQTASDEQERELHARLLASAGDRRLYLHRLNLHSALRRQFAYGVPEETPAPLDLASSGRGPANARRGPTTRLARRLWLVVAAAVVLLVAGVYLLRPKPEPPIATITDMNGALQWTGDGGRVAGDLEAGSSLRGGTLELLSADSWAVLTFRDGSTVTVSGQSTLTISEDHQKQIHMREGSLSASVAPQPRGRPLLIHTPTAKLEVLGTQLNVDVEAASTTLRVNEGRVRATRLADGSVADVPADHQVVVSTSPQSELKVQRRPESVRSWQSRLPRGALYGQWAPGPRAGAGRLRTAPVLLNPGGDPVTLHLLAVSVSRGAAAPVRLTSGARLRIRGEIGSAGEIYFGLTTKHLKGGFAGKYIAAHRIEPAGNKAPGLDIELPLSAFHPQEKEFPASPVGLELVDWWCFTHNRDTGLRLAGVELLPAARPGVATQPASRPARIPYMDMWAAASQGNVGAVRRYLAAGADINGTFVAPGIPASGATPLHMAVLANQGPMARFLIEAGADLNARAKDKHGGAPLHWAAALGRVEMARKLIQAGADVNAPDNHGYTPLDATGYDPTSRKQAKLEIAGLLRRKGGRHSDRPRKPAAGK